MATKANNTVESIEGISNTVSQLYALRAGLSAVSQQYDKLIILSDKLDDEDDKVNQNSISIKINKDAIEKKKEDLRNAEVNISKNRNIYDRTRRIYNDSAGRNYDSRLVYIVFIITCSIFIPLLGEFINIIINYFDHMGGFRGVLYCLTYVDFLLMIGFGIAVIVKTVNRKNAKRQAIYEYNKELSELNRSREKISGELKNLQNKEALLEKQLMQVREQSESNKTDITENEIAPLAYEAVIFGKVLEKTFSKLLNPSDWQNVDLCIFYLQTGRAENIKECLLLADRQRQNDEIVGAICQATDSICSEIRGGFAALGKTMVTCFNSMSEQMEYAFNNIAKQQQQNVQILQSVQSLGADILSAQQLNNALTAKATATSEELVRDYKYVQSNLGIYI